jgi:hypothetical protein
VGTPRLRGSLVTLEDEKLMRLHDPGERGTYVGSGELGDDLVPSCERGVLVDA